MALHALNKTHTVSWHCQGCAWVDILGECAVFKSAKKAWVTGEGRCEAYATEEERDAIEHSIDRYSRY